MWADLGDLCSLPLMYISCSYSSIRLFWLQVSSKCKILLLTSGTTVKWVVKKVPKSYKATNPTGLGSQFYECI